MENFGQQHLGRQGKTSKERVKAQEWKEAGLKDVTFGEVDIESFRDPACVIKIWFLIDMVFSLEYLYLFGSDALAIYSLYQGRDDELVASRIVYLITIVLSILILLVDIQAARHIIQSDDISDSFTNDIANRRQMYRSYAVYCFFYHILAGLPLGQKIAKITYFILRDWKRLLFVDVPQGVIAIASVDNFGGVSTDSAVSEIMLRVKFVIVCVRVGLLVLSCLAWPLIRWKLAQRFDNKGFSLEIYVTFAVDYRINQMLGLIVDPENPGLKPRYKITDASGVIRTVTAHQHETPTTVTPTSGGGDTSTGGSTSPGPRLPFPQPQYQQTRSPHTQAQVQTPVQVMASPVHQAPMVQPMHPGYSNGYDNTGYNNGYNNNMALNHNHSHPQAHHQHTSSLGYGPGMVGGYGSPHGEVAIEMQLPGQMFPQVMHTGFVPGAFSPSQAGMVLLSPTGPAMPVHSGPVTHNLSAGDPYGPQFTVTM